jgi:outer membrane protein
MTPSRGRAWLRMLVLLAAAHASSCAADDLVERTRVATVTLQRAIAEGQWEAAEKELATLTGRIDVDPTEVLFLNGLVALGQKQFDRAADTYRRILDQRPGLARVRLELARTLFEKGDDEGARYHFERTLSAGLPPVVESNVRRFLNAIRQRRNWSLEVGLGVVPDSNINTGTNQPTVTIAGLPFDLSTDAREKSGVGLQLSAAGTKTVVLTPEWQVRAFASVLRRDFAESRYDDMTARFGLGPRYLFPRGEVGVAYLHSERQFGNDSLNRADGVRVDGYWQFAPRLVAEATLERQRFDYPTLRGRNGDVLWTFEGLRYLIGPDQSVLVGVDYYNDHAEDPVLRNRAIGGLLGHYRDWPLGLTTALTGRIARTEYDAVQPLFGRYRDDRLTTWSVALTKRDWSVFEFVPTLSFTAFDNRSSIDFFTFRRTQVLFGFNRRL